LLKISQVSPWFFLLFLSVIFFAPKSYLSLNGAFLLPPSSCLSFSCLR